MTGNRREEKMGIHFDGRAGLLGSLVLALFLVFGGAGFAAAGDQPPSASQIIDALKPKPHAGPHGATRGLTRSLRPAAPADDPAQRRLIESLRHKATRSITVEERKEVAKIAKAKPSIDLEIYFDYDSAEIAPKAVPTLVALGTALRNQELQGAVFVLGGHTDAKGSDEYNRHLSERRAEAVKYFLTHKFGLPEGSLIAIGYGEEQLKNPHDPYAPENRRVQIVNMEQNARH
jgi:outer membrane protein OmpA-like peptidoglycan-associated protein